MEQDGVHFTTSGIPKRFCHLKPALMVLDAHGFIKKFYILRKKGSQAKNLTSVPTNSMHGLDFSRLFKEKSY
jgi:hypothetical protein